MSTAQTGRTHGCTDQCCIRSRKSLPTRNRLIDNDYASSVRDLTGDSQKVFGRVIDNVMTTEISCDLGLRVGTNGTDHSGSEMPRPRTKDMAHAASSRMDQNIISGLHLMRSMQEILRGHPLQD